VNIPSDATHSLISLLDKHNKYGILLSWSIHGQWGHGHINNMNNEEVIEIMKKYGYYQDNWSLEFQQEARKKCGYGWFRKTFLVFVRETLLKE
jgi:hypothetical protein